MDKSTGESGKKMNVLVIGNNPKHAKLFSMFCDNVYILLQNENNGIDRVSRELSNFSLLYSNIKYGTNNFRVKRNREIRNIILNKKIGIVFSNRRDDMIQAKIATFGLKEKPLLLVTFHNSTAWVNDTKVKLMSKLINFCTDGCVCLASFMHKKLLNNGVDSRKLLFLPNTLQHENFIVKDNYCITNGIIKICYTAVLYPLKNQKIIIEAINALKDKYKFEVHLYGDFVDEDYYRSLQKLILEYGLEDVIFLDGSVDNEMIRKMLPLNDIYLSSTTIEMSPYNILEAKASGLPILASNVRGQRDLIEDGVDGILYDIDSQEDLIDKLDWLLSDWKLREKLGKNARNRISTSESYQVASKKLEKFVAEI